MATVGEANSERGQEADASLAAITGRFAAAYQRGERPAIDDYLPADSGGRLAVLPALVLIDLQQRLRAGEMACVEAYLGRYPELADDPATLVNLIVGEYQERQQRQPGLAADEYFRRFPQFREVLARRLGVASPTTETKTAEPLTLAPPGQAPAAPPAAVAPTSEPAAQPLAPNPNAAASPALPIGAILPESVQDWLRAMDRIRDAAMMATFSGVVLALLCLLCLAAVLYAQQNVAGGLGVTVGVGIVSALMIWIAIRTRAGRLWALWAGMLLALFELYNILQYLLTREFHFDAFMGVVCMPLLLMALIQAFAYGFALHAAYANQQAAPAT